ncbi:LysR family transcriptional regulator [Paraburkholderia sp. Tr-20389]|uniref:LysR family transcriptional regulator n=1 Tax=Paraburkholderia sp. Tr-20389 TaxID=2703903 RepID=UPI001980E3A1|nr:LysR family transcriptional regulator [Paraburkholderia sp. Tr-20389]MBN3757524.1 LysR family transcriptional regulator [Paraburkholderia sp. Tr-20389]
MDRFRAMETFVRVIDTGSFSSAARQLGVGQPAISKVVAQLEEWLKVSLLSRSTHGLTPTEAGQRFYERARAAIAEANEAELAARGAGVGLSGVLRVSATTTFSRIHVVPHLPKFLDKHPDLSIDLVMDDRVIDLVAEGIDVSLRIMTSLPDSSVVARKLASGSLLVLGTPAYFDRVGMPQAPIDLEQHEAIIYSQLPSAWTFTRDGAEASVSMRGRARLSAAEGIREAVLSGLGLTVASNWMFTPELASGAVISVLPEWSLPAVDAYAVFPTGRMATAKARTFASFVETLLN